MHAVRLLTRALHASLFPAEQLPLTRWLS